MSREYREDWPEGRKRISEEGEKIRRQESQALAAAQISAAKRHLPEMAGLADCLKNSVFSSRTRNDNHVSVLEILFQGQRIFEIERNHANNRGYNFSIGNPDEILAELYRYSEKSYYGESHDISESFDRYKKRFFADERMEAARKNNVAGHEIAKAIAILMLANPAFKEARDEILSSSDRVSQEASEIYKFFARYAAQIQFLQDIFPKINSEAGVSTSHTGLFNRAIRSFPTKDDIIKAVEELSLSQEEKNFFVQIINMDNHKYIFAENYDAFMNKEHWNRDYKDRRDTPQDSLITSKVSGGGFGEPKWLKIETPIASSLQSCTQMLTQRLQKEAFTKALEGSRGHRHAHDVSAALDFDPEYADRYIKNQRSNGRGGRELSHLDM